jgi:hypothetical protein
MFIYVLILSFALPLPETEVEASPQHDATQKGFDDDLPETEVEAQQGFDDDEGLTNLLCYSKI